MQPRVRKLVSAVVIAGTAAFGVGAVVQMEQRSTLTSAILGGPLIDGPLFSESLVDLVIIGNNQQQGRA